MLVISAGGNYLWQKYLNDEMMKFSTSGKKLLLASLFFFLILNVNYVNVYAQIASSFELRYFSKEKEANGITDFKGETAIFNTDQRVEFLRVYANVRWQDS